MEGNERLSGVYRPRVNSDVLHSSFSTEANMSLVEENSFENPNSCYLFTYGDFMDAKQLRWFARLKILSSRVAFIQGFAVCFNLKGPLPFVSRTQAHLVMTQSLPPEALVSSRASTGPGLNEKAKNVLEHKVFQGQPAEHVVTGERLVTSASSILVEDQIIPTVYGVLHEIPRAEMQRLMEFVVPLEFYSFIPVKAYTLYGIRATQSDSTASGSEEVSLGKYETTEGGCRRRRQKPDEEGSLNPYAVQKAPENTTNGASITGSITPEDCADAANVAPFFLRRNEVLRMNAALCVIGKPTSVWRPVSVGSGDISARPPASEHSTSTPHTTGQMEVPPGADSLRSLRSAACPVARNVLTNVKFPLPSPYYLQLMLSVASQHEEFPTDYWSILRKQPSDSTVAPLFQSCVRFALTWWIRLCTLTRTEVVGWSLLDLLWIFDRESMRCLQAIDEQRNAAAVL